MYGSSAGMLYNPIQVLVVHLWRSSISNNLLDSVVLEKATGEVHGWIISEESGGDIERSPERNSDASSGDCFRELLNASSLERLASAVVVLFFLMTFDLASEEG